MPVTSNSPLVSIIIPVYNAEAFVKEAVESIMAQGVGDFELIAVDDGSTDDSFRELKSITDNRLKIIQQNNSGTGGARNTGIINAKGKYLAFLDADDLWVQGKLKLQLEAIRQPGIDMVFGHLIEFVHNDFPGKAKPIPGLSPITMLIEKEKFLETGLFNSELKLGEFLDWFDRAKNNGFKHLMLPDVVAFRRIHEGNINRFRKNNIKQYASVIKASLDRRRGLHTDKKPDY